MRILLITPYFYPHKGGSQQYAEEIHATLLAKYKNVQVDVLTYNTDKTKKVEKYRGMTIYRVPCIQVLPGQFALPNYIELGKTLNKLFAKNHYDFINSHTRFFESSWLTPFIAKFFKTKSVLTDHCATHPVHKNKFVTEISYLVDRLFVPLIIPLYDEVTVTNSATQKFIKSLTSKKTHIIYGGVDTKSFKKSSLTNRKIAGKSFKKDDIVVSFVGRMIYSKGPQLFLEAAKNLSKKYKNVYFVLGGDGNLYPELSKRKTDHILFAGSLDKSGVSDLLSKTDILVHPSLHHEGFPNVLLEAGASGCAVLATNKGGTYEIITKETGIIIKPKVSDIEKNVEDLIKNSKIRASYGDKLQKWVRKLYDWDKIASDYNEFIKENIV